MKKCFILFIACTLFFGVSSVVSAKTISNTAGKRLTIGTYFFQPSGKVQFTGAISPQAYCIGAYHTATLKKKYGKAFAMADASGGMFWQDISQTSSTAPRITTSAPSGLSGWTPMGSN